MCTFVLIPQSATLLFQRATTLPFDALAHIEQLAPQVSDRSRRFGNADQGVLVRSMSRQDCKVFIGGLSWETTDEKLRTYFLNYGTVHEAFVSYDRHTGRPRGFGFVVFEDPGVADKVVSLQHTIDRREVSSKTLDVLTRQLCEQGQRQAVHTQQRQ